MLKITPIFTFRVNNLHYISGSFLSLAVVYRQALPNLFNMHANLCTLPWLQAQTVLRFCFQKQHFKTAPENRPRGSQNSKIIHAITIVQGKSLKHKHEKFSFGETFSFQRVTVLKINFATISFENFCQDFQNDFNTK